MSDVPEEQAVPTAYVRVPLNEATAEDVFSHLVSHGISVSTSIKDNKDALIGQMELARIPTDFVYVEAKLPTSEASSHQIEDPHTSPYDPNNERWCLIRILPDQRGGRGGQKTPVFVGVNGRSYYVPRGVPVLIKEQFYNQILNCVETRVDQGKDEEGNSIGSFAEARVYQEERYVHSFLGFKGLVRDGLPKNPDGSLVDDPAVRLLN